jgi:hypothetical protein
MQTANLQSFPRFIDGLHHRGEPLLIRRNGLPARTKRDDRKLNSPRWPLTHCFYALAASPSPFVPWVSAEFYRGRVRVAGHTAARKLGAPDRAARLIATIGPDMPDDQALSLNCPYCPRRMRYLGDTDNRFPLYVCAVHGWFVIGADGRLQRLAELPTRAH